MPLLQGAEVVEILIVEAKGDPQRQGSEPGADLAWHLARHGALVQVRQVSAGDQDVGHVLLSCATAFGADLVVMGAYSRSRVRERLFGGVTRVALTEATLPVLMCR